LRTLARRAKERCAGGLHVEAQARLLAVANAPRAELGRVVVDERTAHAKQARERGWIHVAARPGLRTERIEQRRQQQLGHTRREEIGQTVEVHR
jgi:hypothetical protein